VTASRRLFLKTGAIASAIPWPMSLDVATQQTTPTPSTDTRSVKLTGDGLSLSPTEYGRLVLRLVEERGVPPDSYSIGGVVEELEVACARLLGKERAIFMPTGTLANHLAVRALARGNGRVAVQEQSHLYQDSGDCVQTLSGLPLMPLAPGKATFLAEDLQRLIDTTATGRVATGVSVVSVETPVRRANGEMFDPEQISAIVRLAKERGIALHLDGARLVLQSGYTGIDVAEYARPFDTVYVSLYKYFNAPFGAILAGPRQFLDQMHHTRRMFGGGLAQAWPVALVALHFLNGFMERYVAAVTAATQFFSLIDGQSGFAVIHVPNGTNLSAIEVSNADGAAFRARLAAEGIEVPVVNARGRILVAVNETFTRRSPRELAAAFIAAAR
jgi:threonine aldolase